MKQALIKGDEFREMFERVRCVITLTSQLNSVSPDDTASVNTLLEQIIGDPVDSSLRLFPPFGAGATILPGVSIGDKAVVAAGAIVTKDVPASCLVAGVAAQVIRELNVDED